MEQVELGRGRGRGRGRTELGMMEEGMEWGWDVDAKTYGFAMVDKLS